MPAMRLPPKVDKKFIEEACKDDDSFGKAFPDLLAEAGLRQLLLDSIAKQVEISVAQINKDLNKAHPYLNVEIYTPPLAAAAVEDEASKARQKSDFANMLKMLISQGKTADEIISILSAAFPGMPINVTTITNETRDGQTLNQAQNNTGELTPAQEAARDEEARKGEEAKKAALVDLGAAFANVNAQFTGQNTGALVNAQTAFTAAVTNITSAQCPAQTVANFTNAFSGTLIANQIPGIPATPPNINTATAYTAAHTSYINAASNQGSLSTSMPMITKAHAAVTQLAPAHLETYHLEVTGHLNTDAASRIALVEARAGQQESTLLSEIHAEKVRRADRTLGVNTSESAMQQLANTHTTLLEQEHISDPTLVSRRVEVRNNMSALAAHQQELGVDRTLIQIEAINKDIEKERIKIDFLQEKVDALTESDPAYANLKKRLDEANARMANFNAAKEKLLSPVVAKDDVEKNEEAAKYRGLIDNWAKQIGITDARIAENSQALNDIMGKDGPERNLLIAASKAAEMAQNGATPLEIAMEMAKDPKSLLLMLEFAKALKANDGNFQKALSSFGESHPELEKLIDVTKSLTKDGKGAAFAQACAPMIMQAHDQFIELAKTNPALQVAVAQDPALQAYVVRQQQEAVARSQTKPQDVAIAATPTLTPQLEIEAGVGTQVVDLVPNNALSGQQPVNSSSIVPPPQDLGKGKTAALPVNSVMAPGGPTVNNTDHATIDAPAAALNKTRDKHVAPPAVTQETTRARSSSEPTIQPHRRLFKTPEQLAAEREKEKPAQSQDDSSVSYGRTQQLDPAHGGVRTVVETPIKGAEVDKAPEVEGNFFQRTAARLRGHAKDDMSLPDPKKQEVREQAPLGIAPIEQAPLVTREVVNPNITSFGGKPKDALAAPTLVHVDNSNQLTTTRAGSNSAPADMFASLKAITPVQELPHGLDVGHLPAPIRTTGVDKALTTGAGMVV